MIETIGERYWPVFLGALDKHLAPGGRIVLQAITMRHEHLVATRGRSNWIQKYIRSGGQIPSVTAIEEACRAHTGLLVTDAGSFGPDYARTLARWRERFSASHDAVAALGFDEVFERTWHLYLAFRQASLAGGYLDVHHLVLERPGGPAEAPAGHQSQPREPASRWADLGGPVHYADYGGPAGRPVVVCVHGLGGSGRRWAAIAPTLALHYRVLALDLGGFGRSKGNGLPATLPANQALLHRFLVEVVGEPAVLVGHSMGGTIAAMLASEHPELVSGLVLINPAVPWVRDEIDRRLAATRATLTQAFRTGRWEPDTQQPHTQQPHTQQPDSLEPDSLEPAGPGAGPAEQATEPVLGARLIEQYRAAARGRNWTGRVDPDVLAAGRSLASVLLRRREFAAMLSGISAPVLWLHSEDDPAVPIGAARDCARLHPAWRFQVGQDLGHEPHWQAPDWTISQVHPWLDETFGGTRAARGT
jgi:pimeloyl-ACP methyl ester carboxylesterase